MRAKPLSLIILVVALIVTACGSSTPQKVKVAVSLPLGLDVGTEMLHAAELALKQIDSKAGNVTVELASFTTSEPNGNPLSADIELQTIQKIAEDKSFVGFVGSASSNQAKATIPALNAVTMVQISPSATWPGLTKPGFGPGEPGIYYPTGRRHFYRVVPSDDVQAIGAVRWIKQLGYKSVYVIYDESSYSKGLAGIFASNAADEGLSVVGQESINGKKLSESEGQALVDRVTVAKPDVVYYPASSELEEVYQVVMLLHSTAPELPIMGGDGLSSGDIPAEARNLTNLYATQIVVPASEISTAAEFRKNYQSAYGVEPSAYAFSTYEAVKVLLQAIAKAKEPTRDGVLDAMKQLGEISDAQGTWHFDENGDVSLTTISGMQLKDGTWSFVQIIQ
jgi:branched-chain amino acid transport system substrate-binding protein